MAPNIAVSLFLKNHSVVSIFCKSLTSGATSQVLILQRLSTLLVALLVSVILTSLISDSFTVSILVDLFIQYSLYTLSKVFLVVGQ